MKKIILFVIFSVVILNPVAKATDFKDFKVLEEKVTSVLENAIIDTTDFNGVEYNIMVVSIEDKLSNLYLKLKRKDAKDIYIKVTTTKGITGEYEKYQYYCSIIMGYKTFDVAGCSIYRNDSEIDTHYIGLPFTVKKFGPVLDTYLTGNLKN